jgi:hypothetical protein
MTGTEKPLRWKDHSLFPYTCKGCGTKHPKGDGVYLDQSGPRTVTFDNPQCAQQAAPAEHVQKTPMTARQMQLPPPQPAVSRVAPRDDERDRSDQVSLTVSHGGRSVEVVVKVHGEPIAKPAVDRLVTDVSRVVMEDLS